MKNFKKFPPLFSLIAVLALSTTAHAACYTGSLKTKQNVDQQLTVLMSEKDDTSSQIHVKTAYSNRMDISCEQNKKTELCFLMNGGSFILTGDKSAKILTIKGVFKPSPDETVLSIVKDGQERKINLLLVADSICDKNLPEKGWDHVSVAPGEKKATVGVK
jgi:hypothetical protein